MTQFDGSTYSPALDGPRLTSQLARVKELMSDGRWRTLQEIADAVLQAHPEVVHHELPRVLTLTLSPPRMKLCLRLAHRGVLPVRVKKEWASLL